MHAVKTKLKTTATKVEKTSTFYNSITYSFRRIKVSENLEAFYLQAYCSKLLLTTLKLLKGLSVAFRKSWEGIWKFCCNVPMRGRERIKGMEGERERERELLLCIVFYIKVSKPFLSAIHITLKFRYIILYSDMLWLWHVQYIHNFRLSTHYYNFLVYTFRFLRYIHVLFKLILHENAFNLRIWACSLGCNEKEKEWVLIFVPKLEVII